jgi:hypothetical protein
MVRGEQLELRMKTVQVGGACTLTRPLAVSWSQGVA